MGMGERFAAVSSLVGRYGYETRHQGGGEDGTFWEVEFIFPVVSHRHYVVAAPTEEALLDFLARWLPERAQADWRHYALMLEAKR
jgi:hypothetical protein